MILRVLKLYHISALITRKYKIGVLVMLTVLIILYTMFKKTTEYEHFSYNLEYKNVRYMVLCNYSVHDLKRSTDVSFMVKRFNHHYSWLKR